MTPSSAGTEPCGEKAGFLFSHRCRRPSTGRCTTCSRPICEKHLMAGGEGAICITCGKKQRKRKRKHDGDEYGYEESPYFYSSYYYSGYGYYGRGSWGYDFYRDDNRHDPADFSEADGASLHRDSDWDDDFEHDMGGS